MKGVHSFLILLAFYAVYVIVVLSLFGLNPREED